MIDDVFRKLGKDLNPIELDELVRWVSASSKTSSGLSVVNSLSDNPNDTGNLLAQLFKGLNTKATPVVGDLLAMVDSQDDFRLKSLALPIGSAPVLTVYNNSGVTLNQNDPVSFDPTYTSGLGVTTPSSVFDMRSLGIVTDATIANGASGNIYAPGFQVANVNVNGLVVFGHSLISYAPHYLKDSGGGGWGPGVYGWALAPNASGNAVISALIHPYPLFYVGAQVITQKYAGQGPSGAGTEIANVVNVTPNQLLLFFAMGNSAAGLASSLWNAQTPTVVQAGSASLSYLGYLLGAGAATSNWTGYFTANPGAVTCLAMNGVNQGGGANTFGTWANQNGAGTTVNLTVTCNPGDKVVCVVGVIGTSITFSGRNQTPEINNVGAATAVDVQSAVATGNSVNFTLTIGGTITKWSADGVALHSA
jgi:hypothetical protein